MSTGLLVENLDTGGGMKFPSRAARVWLIGFELIVEPPRRSHVLPDQRPKPFVLCPQLPNHIEQLEFCESRHRLPTAFFSFCTAS